MVPRILKAQKNDGIYKLIRTSIKICETVCQTRHFLLNPKEVRSFYEPKSTEAVRVWPLFARMHELGGTWNLADRDWLQLWEAPPNGAYLPEQMLRQLSPSRPLSQLPA